MSRSSDIAAVVRGLNMVRKAGVKHSSVELDRMWNNSTIKTIVSSTGDVIESKVSNAVVSQPEPKEITLEKVVSKATKFAKGASKSIGTGQLPIDAHVLSDTLSKVARILRPPSLTHEHEQNNEAYSLRPAAYDIDDVELSNLERYGVAHPTAEMMVQAAANTDGGEPLFPLMGIDPSEVSPNERGEQAVMQDMVKSGLPPDQLTSTSSSPPPPPPPRSSHIVHPLKVQPTSSKPLAKEDVVYQLNENSKERKVPGSRVARVVSFGSLAAGLGAGAIAEVTRRSLFGAGDKAFSEKNPFMTEANIERIVDTLCRVRGAALKLGQMISIQDDSFISPQLKQIFDRVRHSADFMPVWQMKTAVNNELGPSWQQQLKSFEERPFAAASIGQVHRAVTQEGKSVAMKIQYPGVAKSIESDINNLTGIMKVWKILPDGLYVDKTMEVARKELGYECDYIREAKASSMFRDYLKDDPVFYVPEVISSLSSRNVLTTELVTGESLDRMSELDQDTRNYISENMLRLCLLELFEYHMMQTDPNWSNFLYDENTKRISLLDFGATRTFSRRFTDNYISVIMAAATGNRQLVLEKSQQLGFLSGYESKVMERAHIDAVMILGEPFASSDPFDFGARTTAKRIQELIPVMLKHRLVPPPEESYSLHRKLSGAFLLATKLRGVVSLRDQFFDIYDNFEFDKEDDEDCLDPSESKKNINDDSAQKNNPA